MNRCWREEIPMKRTGRGRGALSLVSSGEYKDMSRGDELAVNEYSILLCFILICSNSNLVLNCNFV